jgi:hypothetical protein
MDTDEHRFETGLRWSRAVAPIGEGAAWSEKNPVSPFWLEQTETQGTSMPGRLAPFSPGEKVSAGRMRGKSPWQIQVHRIAVLLDLPSSVFICVNLCSSVVEINRSGN